MTALVLVHGWCGSAEIWHPIISRLDRAQWDPIIAVRLPGSRGGPARPGTVPSAMAHVRSVLEELNEPAVLVGHSMGAQITLLTHSTSPGRVLSEVVIDPAYAAPASSRQEVGDWADRIDQDGTAAVTDFFTSARTTTPPEVFEQILQDLHDTRPETIGSYLRSEYVDNHAIGLMPATARAAAGRVRPVISLHSNTASAQREHDLPTPPGSHIQTWHDHGHFVHLEEPERFVRFLEQHARGDSR